MNRGTEISVNSEIGELEGVIIHSPGDEVENMTPQNVERALYSDILNLSVAAREYEQFENVLKKMTRTFQVKDLLISILENEKIKGNLIENICNNEDVYSIKDYLLSQSSYDLATQLLEGVTMKKNTLSGYLSKERYALRPLHNFFFTRDASISIGNNIFIGKMKGEVRDRESIIMEAIFDYSLDFVTKTINPTHARHLDPKLTIEGGDILVARDDILCIGIGARTTPEGVDFILEQCKRRSKIRHLIIQELPYTPESFIHLDMVFTFLDQHTCMIYEPLILKTNKYQTIHITIDNGNVASITEERNIIDALRHLGMEIEPVYCGGKKDSWIQEREQWHSGANFFALGEGKVIGYGRNIYTIEEMSNNGFEVIKAKKVINEKVNLNEYKKYVVTIDGSELSRGGGGCRCMTMPVRRKKVEWD